MPTQIAPSAIVHESAVLAADVSVGPYSILGENVEIGPGVEIGAHVVIERDTTVGAGCRIFHGAVLGTDPQDLKYQGERTFLTVGEETIVREFATLNRGTVARGVTTVGRGCLLMAYVHVAHDCEIGEGVILANSVNLGGNVRVDAFAIVGGMTPVHQFSRIGTHAMVGGASRVTKDVPPYCKAAGSPIRLYGLNSVGLDRRGFPENVKRELRGAYRLFFNSRQNVSQALTRARSELHPYPEIEQFLRFIEESDRGITV
ncbi:MAG: acyl-ACP--UDP-N-acetylglucosamine O-acyltransferase [Gemmatimonadetes bacterium]|nr:acyl-ACP--UDP-N-acetylglucosamine O-acyltransferase [Gemmatimonadota bacterium]